ncbi:MAG TPA: hypothetical protein VGN32_19175, partial [Ktedonobacterales bacterium]|nr:hypothetical protein [Ktedonobacterales bacterium]
MKPVSPVYLDPTAIATSHKPARSGRWWQTLTPLDWWMLGSVALSVALNITAARLAWGWSTAAATDGVVGLYLLALAGCREWRPLLGRLLLFGLIVGLMELFTDAAGEQFAHSLVYPAGEPLLWASPIYMPLSWALVLTQIGYLSWRLRGNFSVRLSMLLCGLWAGANIPFYEEMAYHAG